MNRSMHQTLVNTLASSTQCSMPRRLRLLRRAGFDIAEDVEMKPKFWIETNEFRLGRRSFTNVGLTVIGHGPVHIGDDVWIGPNVTIAASRHGIGDASLRAALATVAGVRIGDGVWLGAGVTIAHGLTIGPGAAVKHRLAGLSDDEQVRIEKHAEAVA